MSPQAGGEREGAQAITPGWPESRTSSWIEVGISQGWASQSQDAMKTAFPGMDFSDSSQNREARRHKKQWRKRREATKCLKAPTKAGQCRRRRGLKHGATSEHPHLPPVHAQGTRGTCRLQGSSASLSFDEGVLLRASSRPQVLAVRTFLLPLSNVPTHIFTSPGPWRLPPKPQPNLMCQHVPQRRIRLMEVVIKRNVPAINALG